MRFPPSGTLICSGAASAGRLHGAAAAGHHVRSTSPVAAATWPHSSGDRMVAAKGRRALAPALGLHTAKVASSSVRSRTPPPRGHALASGRCSSLSKCPPFRLSYRGLGEPLCFAAFGPLATSAFHFSNSCRSISRTTYLAAAAEAVRVRLVESEIPVAGGRCSSSSKRRRW
ncbi:hypothetical protein CFC21_021777 [Triticum aestivum]|uniref:Uncharacterized protein n=2 Tax=Triticum aestivum TaxID=4565 RepID=A0A9R1EAL7_WHEAT|nr:uncharacterized protein LOC123043710 isoform X2 [Triticum aestivum]KAF7006771.1 hypothetical protein CFC21_021777 [Triticum aestivum]